MATFQITSPDGAVYEVTAPDGATEQDAIDYVRNGMGQGAPPPAVPQPQARQQEQSPYWNAVDTVNAFRDGLLDTLSFGFSDEARAGINALRPDSTYDQELAAVRQGVEQAKEQHPNAYLGGQLAGGVTGGAGLVRAGLSPTARVINAGRGLGRVSLASGAEGAALGSAQGFGSGEGGVDNRAEEALYGGAGGLILGGAAPGIMQGVGSTVRSVVSPFMTSPERAAAVSALAREGVETSAGQRTGSNTLRYAESEIGGKRAENLFERQGEQFTAAALRRAGINANRATPDVIDDAFDTIGKRFDDLASRNTLVADQQLASDLMGISNDYMQMVPESLRAPIVQNTLADIAGAMRNGGALPGDAYQSLRSRLDRTARSAARDPELSSALRGIKDSLDAAMERSISASNPADAGAWREVRNQYRNMLVIERAATGAGENAAMGTISPSALRNATVTKQGRRNYARGQGDFSELARAGEAVMRPMPNSGTAGRINAQNIGVGLAGLLGAGAGTATGDPYNAAIGAGIGLMAPRMVGRAMMTPAVQGYLSNQFGQQLTMSPQVRAMINSLLNVESSESAPTLGRLLAGPP